MSGKTGPFWPCPQCGKKGAHSKSTYGRSGSKWWRCRYCDWSPIYWDPPPVLAPTPRPEGGSQA